MDIIDLYNKFHTMPLSQLKTITSYTIILLKSVCRRSQTAGRNSCLIVSGDVSNCSYRLKVHPVTSSRACVRMRDVFAIKFVCNIR